MWVDVSLAWLLWRRETILDGPPGYQPMCGNQCVQDLDPAGQQARIRACRDSPVDVADGGFEVQAVIGHTNVAAVPDLFSLPQSGTENAGPDDLAPLICELSQLGEAVLAGRVAGLPSRHGDGSYIEREGQLQLRQAEAPAQLDEGLLNRSP